MNSELRTWLVTGAAGFLGSHVIEQLIARGYSVVAVDDLSAGKKEFIEPFLNRPDFTLAEMDMRWKDNLSDLLKEHSVSAAVHLAALHFIPAAIANPPLAVSLNVHGTQSVLTACQEAGVRRFWFASTGDVYVPSEEPLREDSPLGPFNIYGLTKHICEQLIQLEVQNQPETHFVIGRLFNLYGPRETNPHILPEIIKQIKERPGEALRLGSLWPRRDLVPVSEAAKALIEMVEKAPMGLTTCNVATGKAVSMQEVIDQIGEILGNPIPVETDPARVRKVERPHLQADVSKLKQLLGWTPHGNLTDGLKALLAFEKMLSN